MSLLRPVPALFVVALALLTTACSTTGAQSDGDQDSAALAQPQGPTPQELFLEANEALDARQWEDAVDLYTQVTDADPERWDAHMNRGIALSGAGDYVDATEAFAQALESGGQDEAILYFNLGNHYQARGHYESSIDAYRHAMAVGGGLDYDALLNIGAAFIFLDVYDKARTTLERAIELDPQDPRGYVSLGVLTFSEGQADEALDLYDRLLADHPRLADAHYNRGYVLLQMRDDDQARQAFEQYLELSPEGPYAAKAENHLRTIERRAQ